MKIPLLLLLFCCITSTLFSQEDPLYAQYINNPFVINPAYAGLNKNFNASATYRKQWTGYEGSPITSGFNAHTSLVNNKVGLGLLLTNNKAGNTHTTETSAAYAYHVNLGNQYLSFGLQAGVINFRNANNELNPFDPTDPAFNGDLNITKPTVGAGLILHNERFFVGLSAPRMLRSSATLIDQISTELYSQHYYATGAYVFYLNERIRLKPSVLVKYVSGAPLSVDYNMAVTLDEKYTLGAYTRNLNTYGLLTQLRFAEAYRFIYAFEIPTNQSVGNQFNTHEITIGINLALFRFQDSTITNF